MTGTRTLINRIASDTQITADEFAEMERTVFAGDGVIDLNEEDILKALQTSTSSYSEDFVVFDDSEDLLRIELLATHGIRTLDQYLDQLRTSAMTPRNAPDILMKLAKAPKPEELRAQILFVEEADETYEIALRKGGETFWIDLPKNPRDETGGLIVSETLNETPCDGFEVMEALRKFAEGRKTGDAERSRAIDLAQILHTLLRHQRLTSPQGFDLFVNTLRDDGLSTQLQGELDHLAQSASNLPEIPVEEEALFSSYQGESATPEIGRILSAMRQVFPPRVIDWVRRTQASLSILPLSRHLRDFYNRHPEITQPILFDGFADVATMPPSLVLNSKDEVAELLYTMAHELGHLVRAIIRGETLTSRKTTGGTRESTSDGVLSAHWEASIKVQEGAGLLLSGSPTSYGGVSQEEWFADIFAIYFLGKTSPFLEKTLAVSYEQIFEEFKQRDPVGYLLMVRLDQYLSGDNRYRPAVTFSWSSLNEAGRFLSDSMVRSISGKSDPLEALDQTMEPEFIHRLERQWRNRPPPDLRAEREYSRILAMETDSPDTYEAFLARLERLNHQSPFFYPARRDLWLEALDLRIGIVPIPVRLSGNWKSLSTTLSDGEIVAGIGEIFSTVSQDPVVVARLEYAAQSALIGQHLYEGEDAVESERTAFLLQIAPLIRKLAGERNAAGMTLLPLLLVLEGRPEKAASLLADETSIVYSAPKWKVARAALSASLPDADDAESSEHLLRFLNAQDGSHEDFSWIVWGLQQVIARLQKQRRYEPLLDLLFKIVDANPVLLVEASRVLDRSVVEGHLKASPQWEKIRRRFVEKFDPGFLFNPAVESSGFSKLYGIKWVEKDGLPYPQLAD